MRRNLNRLNEMARILSSTPQHGPNWDTINVAVRLADFKASLAWMIWPLVITLFLLVLLILTY